MAPKAFPSNCPKAKAAPKAAPRARARVDRLRQAIDDYENELQDLRREMATGVIAARAEERARRLSEELLSNIRSGLVVTRAMNEAIDREYLIEEEIRKLRKRWARREAQRRYRVARRVRQLARGPLALEDGEVGDGDNDGGADDGESEGQLAIEDGEVDEAAAVGNGGGDGGGGADDDDDDMDDGARSMIEDVDAFLEDRRVSEAYLDAQLQEIAQDAAAAGEKADPTVAAAAAGEKADPPVAADDAASNTSSSPEADDV